MPSWSYRVEGTYSLEDWTFDLIGRGVSAGKYSNQYIECQTTCPAYTLAQMTVNNNQIAGAFYFDTTVSYEFRTYDVDSQLFFTLKNLFNTSPVIMPFGGANTVVTISEHLQTNTSVYDVLGRVFRVGFRAKL